MTMTENYNLEHKLLTEQIVEDFMSKIYIYNITLFPQPHFTANTKYNFVGMTYFYLIS